MLSFRIKSISLVFAFLVIVSTHLSAQTPTPTPPDEKPEVVYTEEIKLNIAAFDKKGNFAENLKKEDIVISEDGQLHQPNIVTHIPASVLILLDTGGKDRQAKDFKTTRSAAIALINSLQPDDKFAVMQYFDKVELLSGWTSDKAQAVESLKKMNFGMQSRFSDALSQTTEYLQKLPAENRHLVLITDGLDTTENQERRKAVFKNLTATNVNVHILSYTKLEKTVVAERKGSLNKGRRTPPPPPGAGPGNQITTVPIFTINLDREMARKIKERGESLERSEMDLAQIAQDTNGIFYLPASREELIEKTASLAKNIDSQYVVTYTPKRALSESPEGEVRNIEVSSKRDGVEIIARRKIIVMKDKR